MKPLEAFRGKLYEEILGRIKETDESVPYRRHGYWYYQREVEGCSTRSTRAARARWRRPRRCSST
jgi:protease II